MTKFKQRIFFCSYFNIPLYLPELRNKHKLKNIKRPPYKNFPMLASEKIVLREILQTDIKDIIEISFYDGKQAVNENEAAKMQANIEEDYQKGDSIHWGIARKEDNLLIGTCGFYRGFAEEKGELGCVLMPNFQGKGYMTTALQLAIEFGIEKMQLSSIFAITSSKNEKAIRLLERLHFVKVENMKDDMLMYRLAHSPMQYPHK